MIELTSFLLRPNVRKYDHSGQECGREHTKGLDGAKKKKKKGVYLYKVAPCYMCNPKYVQTKENSSFGLTEQTHLMVINLASCAHSYTKDAKEQLIK